jgi:Phycobilisome degradation protein nblA
MSELTFEKQFAHTIFCQQVQDLDIDNAKMLLVDLHLLYLAQQALFAELIKQDTFIDI